MTDESEKPSFEERRARARAELLRDPSQANRIIAKKAQVSADTVRLLREKAEEQHEVPVLSSDERQHFKKPAVLAELVKNPARSNEELAAEFELQVDTVRRIRRSAEKQEKIVRVGPVIDTRAPRSQTAVRIKELLEQGFNTFQIAAEIKRSERVVRGFINSFHLSHLKRSNEALRMSDERAASLAAETVSAVGGLVQGLRMIEERRLVMTREQATELLKELAPAMRHLRLLQKSFLNILTTDDRENNHGN